MIPLIPDPITMVPKYYLGPHFYIFIPTWFVSIGLMIYILSSLKETASPTLLGFSIFFSLLFLYYYFKTGFSAPGIASSNIVPDFSMRSNQRYCVPCRIIRPSGTQHCYYCDVCIAGMDHHCPWVGKCIGKDNLCLFYKFLVACGCMMTSLLITAVTATPNNLPQQNMKL
jgi:hypothetical protein